MVRRRLMTTATGSASFVTESERIRETLRERILSGELAPDERLVVSTLAKEFAVSVFPVREALKGLEEARLVVGRPGWGYQVARFDRRAQLGLWHVREALECHAARMCALKAREYHLVELRERARIADRPAAALRKRGIVREQALKRFHIRVAEIAGYPELTEELTRICGLMQILDPLKAKVKRELRHADLVDEIASGDPDRADRAMRIHLETPPDDEVRF